VGEDARADRQIPQQIRAVIRHALTHLAIFGVDCTRFGQQHFK